MPNASWHECRGYYSLSLYTVAHHISKWAISTENSLISSISVSSHAASSSAVNAVCPTNENFLYIRYIRQATKILNVDVSKAV